MRFRAADTIAACHGKQLKLHDRGSAVFAAHKQMFLGVPLAGLVFGATSPNRDRGKY